jgi:heme-degrading monooxygenase HmoA
MVDFYSPCAPGVRKTLQPLWTEGPGLGSGFYLTKEKERSTVMFARILDFEVKMEKKEEFVNVVKEQVLPILKKQTGFLEILPFFPEKMREEKVFTISLWTTKQDAERYEREFYPKVFDLLKPFLSTPVQVNYYKLETTLCEHFIEALAA